GQDDSLFAHFSTAAQRLGVYTAKDYADILEFLVERLRLCQAFLVKDTRLRTLSVDYLQESAKLKRELKEAAKEAAKNVPFSWIFGR
ncbi:unnamed protein product, partial [Brassica rapa subsp. narinosa]